LTGALVASPTNVSIHHGQAAAFSQFEFVTCMQLNHKSNITKHALEKLLARVVFANTGLFLRPHIKQPKSHPQLAKRTHRSPNVNNSIYARHADQRMAAQKPGKVGDFSQML
jgi:hypothetical protein